MRSWNRAANWLRPALHTFYDSSALVRLIGRREGCLTCTVTAAGSIGSLLRSQFKTMVTCKIKHLQSICKNVLSVLSYV